MPWILCGPGWPPESTGLSSAPSTATMRREALRGFSTWPMPVMVPPVPTPETTRSTAPSVSFRSPPPWWRGDGGIRLVLELLRHHRLGDFLEQFLGAGDGAAHAEVGGGQHKLGAQQGQHLAALHRHALGHDEDEAQATGGGDEGERDGRCCRRWAQPARYRDRAGRPRRWRRPWRRLCGPSRWRWIEELELGQDVGLHAAQLGQPVQAHQRRVADGLGDGIIDTAPARTRAAEAALAADVAIGRSPQGLDGARRPSDVWVNDQMMKSMRSFSMP